MQIFISYSIKDKSLVSQIVHSLPPNFEVRYWDKDKIPGEPVWESIEDWIDESDLVIAVITDNTVQDAMAVGNEIGISKEKRKDIIPIISHNVPDNKLGCLQGLVYVRIDRDNPGPAMEEVKRKITKIERKELIKNSLFVAGLVGLIWLASRE